MAALLSGWSPCFGLGLRGLGITDKGSSISNNDILQNVWPWGCKRSPHDPCGAHGPQPLRHSYLLTVMTPPQPSIPPVATILGTVSTVLWCVQLIPQIWQNWRRKSTEGVPSWMMFLWALCAPPYGVYAIVQDFNIPVQMQPQIFTFLTLIAWSQTLIYSHRWATWKATAAGIGVGALLGGIEVMLVFCFRVSIACFRSKLP